jgi:hypothetical protein
MGLSQRGYARHRSCSLKAVQKAIRTGRVALLPDGTIDPEIADRAWTARTAATINGTARRRTPAAGMVVDAGAYHQARTAKLEAEAERAAFELRVRKREFVARAVVERHLFAFGRQLRDHWTTWPARIGPELAATLEVDPFVLITHLDDAVRLELTAIADERCTF